MIANSSGTGEGFLTPRKWIARRVSRRFGEAKLCDGRNDGADGEGRRIGAPLVWYA
jgi:hypothetical protein